MLGEYIIITVRNEYEEEDDQKTTKKVVVEEKAGLGTCVTCIHKCSKLLVVYCVETG